MLALKKEENINTKKWIEIIGIGNDFYYTKDKVFQIVKVMPVNYELKSDLEKEAILESFKKLLRTCNFNFEIICRSQKQNISKMISKIEENDINNYYDTKNKKMLADEYIKYLKKLVILSKSASKSFYILHYISIVKDGKKRKIGGDKDISEKSHIYRKSLYKNSNMIIEMLERCGNKSYILKDDELKDFLKINIRQKEVAKY